MGGVHVESLDNVLAALAFPPPLGVYGALVVGRGENESDAGVSVYRRRMKILYMFLWWCLVLNYTVADIVSFAIPGRRWTDKLPDTRSGDCGAFLERIARVTEEHAGHGGCRNRR